MSSDNFFFGAGGLVPVGADGFAVLSWTGFLNTLPP